MLLKASRVASATTAALRGLFSDEDKIPPPGWQATGSWQEFRNSN